MKVNEIIKMLERFKNSSVTDKDVINFFLANEELLTELDKLDDKVFFGGSTLIYRNRANFAAKYMVTKFIDDLNFLSQSPVLVTLINENKNLKIEDINLICGNRKIEEAIACAKVIEHKIEMFPAKYKEAINFLINDIDGISNTTNPIKYVYCPEILVNKELIEIKEDKDLAEFILKSKELWQARLLSDLFVNPNFIKRLKEYPNVRSINFIGNYIINCNNEFLANLLCEIYKSSLVPNEKMREYSEILLKTKQDLLKDTVDIILNEDIAKNGVTEESIEILNQIKNPLNDIFVFKSLTSKKLLDSHLSCYVGRAFAKSSVNFFYYNEDLEYIIDSFSPENMLIFLNFIESFVKEESCKEDLISRYYNSLKPLSSIYKFSSTFPLKDNEYVDSLIEEISEFKDEEIETINLVRKN